MTAPLATVNTPATAGPAVGGWDSIAGEQACPARTGAAMDSTPRRTADGQAQAPATQPFGAEAFDPTEGTVIR